MKRTILTGLLAIGAGATCLMAQAPPPAAAAAPGPMPVAKAPKTQSKSELDAVKAMYAAAGDPDKTIAAVEQLITKYADTEFKRPALDLEADAYQKKGDFNKMEICADRVLEINPQDWQALLMLCEYYAGHTRENDLDREEKLGKVEKYANLLIEVMKTEPKPTAQVTDQQWADIMKDTAAEGYNAIGLANMTRKKYDVAASSFRSALDTVAGPEPAYMVRLALALQSGGKNEEAIAWCDKALAVPNVHPQVKDYAQKIRAMAVKAAAPKAPVAPPPAK